MKRPNNHAGFTLIEVMVAATILIVVITTMTFIYQTAARSSLVASRNIELHSNIGLLLNDVKSELRTKGVTEPKSKSGQFGAISYSWQSELIKAAPPPDRFNPEKGLWEKQPVKFYLWQVTLNVYSGQASKTFVFNELSWK
ncbi:PilW family protein [Thalassotalea montiporae]